MLEAELVKIDGSINDKIFQMTLGEVLQQYTCFYPHCALNGVARLCGQAVTGSCVVCVLPLTSGETGPGS